MVKPEMLQMSGKVVAISASRKDILAIKQGLKSGERLYFVFAEPMKEAHMDKIKGEKPEKLVIEIENKMQRNILRVIDEGKMS